MRAAAQLQGPAGEVLRGYELARESEAKGREESPLPVPRAASDGRRARKGWRDRRPFLTALDDALYTRWPSAARTGYVPSDEDAEDAEDDWGKSDEKKPPKPDGALLLIAEGAPASRVRVVRAEMEEGVVVKEMSEASVLSRLQKDLDALEKARRSAR